MSRMDEYLMAIITGENEDLPEPRSSTEREFYEAAKRGLGGGELLFGETTVMGDTLTWDGDTEGLYSVAGIFYHVSDATPTLEDLQRGGSATTRKPSGEEITAPYVSDEVIDLSSVSLGTDCAILATGSAENIWAGVAFKAGATANLQGYNVTFEKAGTYLLSSNGHVITQFTINNYTGFERTEIKPLPSKYMPGASVVFTMENFYANSPSSSTVTCNKTFGELLSMTDAELATAIAMPVIENSKSFLKTVGVSTGVGTLDGENYQPNITFSFITVLGGTVFAFGIMMFQDGTIAAIGNE